MSNEQMDHDKLDAETEAEVRQWPLKMLKSYPTYLRAVLAKKPAEADMTDKDREIEEALNRELAVADRVLAERLAAGEVEVEIDPIEALLRAFGVDPSELKKAE